MDIICKNGRLSCSVSHNQCIHVQLNMICVAQEKIFIENTDSSLNLKLKISTFVCMMPKKERWTTIYNSNGASVAKLSEYFNY